MSCPVCNGRIVKTSTGKRCLKPDCEGTKVLEAEGGTGLAMCCRKTMTYTGLNQLGEPVYKCGECGRTQNL